MPFYRKLPVVIEAYQIDTLDYDGLNQIIKWCGGSPVGDGTETGNGIPYSQGDTAYDAVISINTLEGIMYAKDGDYIIKGIKGEFYPCKPDIFEVTYEPNGLGQPSPANHGDNLWG